MTNHLWEVIRKSGLSNTEKIFWEGRILPHLSSVLMDALAEELNEYPHLLDFYTKNFMEKLNTSEDKEVGFMENFDYILYKIKQDNEKRNV